MLKPMTYEVWIYPAGFNVAPSLAAVACGGWEAHMIASRYRNSGVAAEVRAA